jgi:RNA polymerase sigma factor (sigma-70 family)
MTNQDFLAKEFDAKREHLRAVAFRMLGSKSEAEDAVQETWLKLSRAGTENVDNLAGFMTTVVARVCLDMLRSRSARREDPKGSDSSFEKNTEAVASAPDRDRLLADSVGLALHVVLETLAPAERVAFVLHDMFDLSFDEIAPIVDRTPEAARQLASRARNRVQRTNADRDADISGHRKIVEAFLNAARTGNLAALLAVLDPEIVLRADAVAVAASAKNPQAPQLSAEMHGAKAVGNTFVGRAQAARVAWVDGRVAAVWAPGGEPRAVFAMTFADEKITSITMIADPERIASFDIDILVSANPG